MKKWFVGASCALLLAAFVSIPSGCGGGAAEKIDADQADNTQPPGHEAALEKMNAKPSGG